MKYFLKTLSLLLVSHTAGAQIAENQQKKDGNVISFETNLSEGALIFIKTFRKENSLDAYYQAHYTLINPLYHSGKPTEIRLNKESFDLYFRSSDLLLTNWKKISDYATAKKLDYNNEADWTTLLNYYNRNCVTQ